MPDTNSQLFKKLTGKSGGYIAAKWDISRQYVHQLMNNKSLTYKLAKHAILTIIIDEKIEELRKEIIDLEILKSKITDEAYGEDDK